MYNCTTSDRARAYTRSDELEETVYLVFVGRDARLDAVDLHRRFLHLQKALNIASFHVS